jgi:hypothetical protein
MTALQLFQMFLALIVPGFIGALIYSIFARLTTEINTYVALILDLFTFVIMITGLYYFKGVTNITALLAQFECLSFTRKYILLSLLIQVLLGAASGLLRRLFFWIRRRVLPLDTPGI